MLSDKSVQEFKEIFKKKYNKDISDEEAREQGGRLVALAEILVKQAEIELRRKKRLEKEPEGFFLDASEGPYSCGICGANRYGNEIWWTLEGLRCADCWRNICEGIIPSLSHMYDNDGVWFADWQIKSDYGIHPATAGKLRRQGLLHGRDLTKSDGSVYHTVYLVNENEEFLKKYPRVSS